MVSRIPDGSRFTSATEARAAIVMRAASARVKIARQEPQATEGPSTSLPPAAEPPYRNRGSCARTRGHRGSDASAVRNGRVARRWMLSAHGPMATGH
jgi:hypothetical protein